MAKLNASYNCLDRHLATQPGKVAIIFEADDGKITRITYKDLHARVCEFANGLKALGLKKGDRVIVYYADEHRSGGGDAGLCAARHHPFGRIRRLLREEPA
jgi:acyl-coenzyme A synthetase/AMP-(fatty) acid ligase